MLLRIPAGRYLFGLLALILVAVVGPSYAWLGHGAQYDTYLVLITGDSNSGSGECFNAANDTLAPATVLQLKHNFTTARAQEPLDLISIGTSCGANVSGVSGDVGSTTKLVQTLVANGKVPPYIQRIVIIPSSWAGTGLNVAGNAYWVPFGNAGCNSTNKCGCALDGAVNWACGIAAGTGLYGLIDHAKSLYPQSKIWFVNMIEGANDGGMTQANWTAAAQSLFTDLRSKYPDAATAPILWTGIPPDRINTSLGWQTNLTNVITAQQAIGSNISHAFYVDPSAAPVLHSYFDNGYVHFNSASQRGGTPNFILNKSSGNATVAYNSGTGDVTITYAANSNAAVGSTVVVSGVTGTGSFASVNGTFTAAAGTNGTTVHYTIATGLTMTTNNSGNTLVTNGWVYNSAVTYAPPGSFFVQNTVVASDGFIYTCIATTTGNDPTTDGGVHWSKQWDTTAAVNDNDSLAGRQYQQLLAAGF